MHIVSQRYFPLAIFFREVLYYEDRIFTFTLYFLDTWN